ncbi:MAG: phosphoadenosine phosphosulfate reductase family protein [Planctomycetales bacterium]|nr:phosphoadenosine phosphosulfate reductase family protein [Planctomycetales bacterium]
MIANVTDKGIAEVINPFDHGSKVDTEVMRTQPLKQTLTKYGFDGAIGGGRATKSDRGRRNVSFRTALGNIAETCATSDQSCGICTTPGSSQMNVSACFRCRIG